MIALMRKLIHNNVYKIFLWAFLIMMAMGSGLVFFRDEDPNWVIKVYGQTISSKKFATMLQMTKQQHAMFRQRGFVFKDFNAQKDTVEAGISKLLTRYAIDGLGVKIPSSHVDREVQRQLQHLPAYFFDEKGTLNEAAFMKLIAPSTIDDFISDIEHDSKDKLLFGLIDLSLYAPKFELMLQYNADVADKTYSYISLPYQSYLQEAKKNTPSDETLQKFYKTPSVADQFRTLERRSGTMWTFNDTQYVKAVTDTEIKQYYDKQKTTKYILVQPQMQLRILTVNIPEGKLQEAKDRMQNIKEEADKNPDSFEELVRKFSDDKSLKNGLTDLFTRDTTKYDKNIVHTAFDYLANDGQISAPLKADDSFVLIQRVRKVPAKYKDLSAVENEIRQSIGSEKFKKRFVQDAARVIQEAKYNTQALTKFIERYHGLKSALSMDVRQKGIEYTNLFRIEQGRYTQFFDNENGVILLCNEIEKSVLPLLEDVKSKVLSLFYERQASDILKTKLAQAFKDAQTLSLADVATKYDSTVHTASVEHKNGKIEQSSILKDPVIQAKLKDMQYPGAMQTIVTPNSGILIKVTAIEDSSGNLESALGDLKKTAMYAKAYQSKEGFVASLYRIAKLNNKIEIKNEILQFTKEV